MDESALRGRICAARTHLRFDDVRRNSLAGISILKNDLPGSRQKKAKGTASPQGDHKNTGSGSTL
jgi:hypothetical protein